MKRKYGFTLIELLVVIAIIGLLLSVLIPALSKAKIIAWRVICATDQRGFVQAYRQYSEQWDGKIPIGQVGGAGGWFWDIDYRTTDLLMQAGMLPKNFYCPSNKTKWPPPPWGKDERWWRWSEWGATPPASSTEPASSRQQYFRVIGYIPLIDMDDPTDNFGYGNVRDKSTGAGRLARRMDLNPANPHKEWAENINTLPNTGEYEMIVDTEFTQQAFSPGVFLQNYTWRGIQGGSYTRWGITDDSSHLDRRLVPYGTNIGYADGHVKWRDIKEMHCWFTKGQSWWY